MNIDFRPLVFEDYNEVEEICKDIWDGSDYLPQLFYQWIQDDGLFLAAIHREKNKVVGVDKFSILKDGTGWLEGLRVHKDYRGMKIGRLLSEKIVAIAMEKLEEKKINKIAFSTHSSNIGSRTIMDKFPFELKEKYIMVLKEKEPSLVKEDFLVEPWDITLEEFLNLNYFKRRGDLIPLAFVFQRPTKELYEELKALGAFVKINNHKGIIKIKGDAYFIAAEETIEAIDTFMNYCLVEYKNIIQGECITTIMEEDKGLIQELKSKDFITWENWSSDYLYYVYAGNN